MQQGPKIFIPAKNDVAAAASIAAIRTRLWIELGAHEMFASRTTVPTSAKYPYVINEIGLLHPACNLLVARRLLLILFIEEGAYGFREILLASCNAL
jgi:hypothetical protein